ncbi:MAG: response regulator [Candidatus Omnitrophica bacterium]|nr:hypothetical protein [bacterium]NUN94638.1 response regulator [Candidatus Omnitrophota bacterium]
MSKEACDRVLLMEDDPAVGEMMEKMLLQLGFDPHWVRRGEHAIQAYRETLMTGQCYDSVILDLFVEEGMGGIETLKGLRELDPNVKALAATGAMRDQALPDYTEIGFRTTLAKPFTMNELSRALQMTVTGVSVE